MRTGTQLLHASPAPGVDATDKTRGALLSTENAHARALSSESEYQLVSGSGSSSAAGSMTGDKPPPIVVKNLPGTGSAGASSAGNSAPASAGVSSHSGSRGSRGDRTASGRSDGDSSEMGDLGQTDAESRGLSDEEEEDEEDEEGAGELPPGTAPLPSSASARKLQQQQQQQVDEAALLDQLNAYEDHPTVLTPSSMPRPNPAPWGLWSEDDTSALNVRGPTFLEDKIKVPVGVPIFKLQHVDMFYTSQDKPTLVHVTARPGNWGHKYLERRERKWRDMHGGSNDSVSLPPSSDANAPLFVMNFLFPGPANKNMNLVLYFIRRVRPGEELKRRTQQVAGAAASGATSTANSSRRTSESNVSGVDPLSSSSLPGSVAQLPPLSVSKLIDISRVCAFDGLLRNFLDGADSYRDCRLKIIPRIAAGPWLVRKGVGCVPAILGKKVQQRYYRGTGPGRNYMEIVADVSSSMVAGRILALVKGAAQALTIDLSFLLQGETPEELPESLMGGVRIMQCNLDGLLTVEEHETWLEDVWLKQEREAGRW
jgi:hypothetical protein